MFTAVLVNKTLINNEWTKLQFCEKKRKQANSFSQISKPFSLLIYQSNKGAWPYRGEKLLAPFREISFFIFQGCSTEKEIYRNIPAWILSASSRGISSFLYLPVRRKTLSSAVEALYGVSSRITSRDYKIKYILLKGKIYNHIIMCWTSFPQYMITNIYCCKPGEWRPSGISPHTQE